jgi:hypothetical protein
MQQAAAEQAGAQQELPQTSQVAQADRVVVQRLRMVAVVL